jgi:integrase
MQIDPKSVFESLVMGKTNGSIPNPETVLLDAFDEYLRVKAKVSDKVRYEYVRIAKHFLEEVYEVKMWLQDPRFMQIVTKFLDIENPYTYRNTLASMKHLFALLQIGDYLKDFKFRASMPSFSIATPSFEDVLKFHDAIEENSVRFYFELGINTAIRPEHMLKLTKRLFDVQNRMVNTWQKTFSKKNFFFSFYTEDLKPKVELYVKDLPNGESVLFPFSMRYVQKRFIQASEKSGIQIQPKMMRKFTTNWLRRHGMIPEDVDAITSHLPYSVVARHYLDSSRIHQEYDRAMQEIKFEG